MFILKHAASLHTVAELVVKKAALVTANHLGCLRVVVAETVGGAVVQRAQRPLARTAPLRPYTQEPASLMS